MPRVLLLFASTSYRAGDFLAAARSLGVDVVVGSDHHQVLGRHSAGRSLFVDLADPPRAAAQIVAHARAHPVDAVIGADDESVLAAAAAANGLGLVHNAPEAVALARDKLRFRETLRDAGVPGPRFKRVTLDAPAGVEPLAFPCVLKPRSLSASRGVIRVDGPGELDAAARRVAAILEAVPASMNPGGRTALLEEYLPGDEVALEGMLSNGALTVLAVFDKPDPLHGPYFEETLLVTPSRHAPELIAAASRRVGECAQALGLRFGPVHAELRVDAGDACVIELAPRSIGGLCSRALRFPGGESLESRVIRNVLSLPPPAAEPVANPASGVMMIPVPRAGRLDRVDGVAAARGVAGIEDVILGVSAGEELVPLPEGGRYLGFIFARGDSAQAVERALRDAHACLGFRIR